MSAIVSRSAHPWAANHRLLFALVAFAIALAASVVIVVMTSAGSSSSPSFQTPGHGQQDNLNRVQVDLENKCLQGMQAAC